MRHEFEYKGIFLDIERSKCYKKNMNENYVC
jgi:hypothetical protein